jgi:NAD(P)-dependent dehydrogenase (short-subunit alcohol dehydrogenase family)
VQAVSPLYGNALVCFGGDVRVIRKTYGRLDILVNNSGVYEAVPLEEISEPHFHRLFDINVLGLLLTTKAAAKHFLSASHLYPRFFFRVAGLPFPPRSR